MRRILLIDSDNLAHRAFYATYRGGSVPVMSSDGFPTNAISTWSSMLGSLIAQADPHQVIFGLEGGSAYRRGIFPEYKGNRDAKPKQLVQQLPVINALIRDAGVEFLFADKEECDDALMTYAESARGLSGVEILIASEDKDFGQIVGANVFQLKPGKGGQWRRLDAEAIKQDYGVEASQIALYLALVGDNPDNIPGIEGIGEGTAPKLLAGAPSFEQLIMRVAAKKKWDETRVSKELTRNLSLTAFRMVKDLHVNRGNAPTKAIEELTRLNCVHATRIWQRMIERFGPSGSGRSIPPATPAPAATVKPPAKLQSAPAQAELRF